jgi:thioredoxin 1
MSVEINGVNFQKEVIEASTNKPVLVDFFAQWCGPCKMQGPIVDELAKDMEGKAVVGKLDIEVAEGIASKYGVMSVPTMLVFRDGEVKETMTGLREKGVLKEVLEKYLQ